MKSNDKNTQSKTKVYQRLHGGRALISIRCRREVKEQLLKFCKVNGLSICHMFEMLTTGYLTGMKQKITWVNQSPTIELTVVRDVKRIRRYARESGAGDGRVEEVEEPSGFVPCAFSGCGCRNPAVLELRKEGVGRVHACPSHVEYFKKRHFVEWTRVVEGGLGGDWGA